MKALIFINTSWNIVNFRSGLIRALLKKGYEVHALAPEDKYSSHLPAMGVIYHPITMDNSRGHIIKDLGLLKQINQIYKKVKPDVTLHYTVKPNIYGSIAARWQSIPCINTVSGLGTVFLTESLTSKVAKLLYRWSFGYPQRVFFQNAEDLDQFQSMGLLTKTNHGVVGGSGVNTQFFEPTKLPSKEPFTFLMMARLLEDKGVREYAKAAETLKAKGLNIQCNLLGNPEIGHSRGVPSAVIETWVANGYINYLGETGDVKPFINQSHIVVLPSYREGLPKSLLEAASMQRPLIATRVPGCMEVVKDQINGFLCRPKDSEDLAVKMEAMYNRSKEALESMGQAGRALVQAKFEEHVVVDQYLKAIGLILNKNNYAI